MELSGEHRFSAPRERVWALLLDPQILQQCLPGAEDLVEVGPEEYEARMKIGVAAIRGTYQGRVKIQDKDEPNSYCIDTASPWQNATWRSSWKIIWAPGADVISTGAMLPMTA